MGAAKGVRTTLLIFLLVLLVIAFFSFIAYISWSLHQFLPAAPHLKTDCASLKDATSLKEYLKNRTVLVPPVFTNASEGITGAKCWAIRKRWYMPGDVPDSMEVHHALYLIRIVSRDYEYFEQSLNMLFSPLHFYCFLIGDTATERFEQKVRFLGECQINVIVPPGRFDETNATDTFRGHASCFDRMDGFEWKHAVVTQESEIPLQSVHFLADSMRRLGDASRVGNELISEETTRILSDGDGMDVDAEELVRNAACTWLNGKREPLALSRSFAKHFYSLVDEPSLGGCQSNISSEGPCSSRKRDKNGNCIWGMENYQQAMRSKSLFARADPRFDFGFIECAHEFVFRRTYDTSSYRIHYGH